MEERKEDPAQEYARAIASGASGSPSLSAFSRGASDEWRDRVLSLAAEMVRAEEKVGDRSRDRDRFDRFANSMPHSDDPSLRTIRCRKCGGSVEWSIRQTRKADEGSTVFCECTQCHVRWKM